MSTSDVIAGPAYGWLLFGVLWLALAVGGTFTGETLVRIHGWIFRSDDPKQFRWVIVMYYLLGLLFIGLFFYTLH